MIVAYVSPHDQELRDKVSEAAAPAEVVFRDPATFMAGDADPLDQIVYVADDAPQIRAIYADHATRHMEGNRPQVLSLSGASLDKPPAHLVDRIVKRQQAGRRLPVDTAAQPQVAPPNLQNRPPTRREMRQQGERQEGEASKLPETPGHPFLATAQSDPATAQPAPKTPVSEKK